MHIHGEQFILRAIEYKDLEMLKDMVNNPNIEKFICGFSLPISTKQQEEWIQSLSKNRNDIKLTIELDNGESIGMCSLNQIDWKNRYAGIGIKLIESEEVRDKGIGTKVLKSLIKYAFEELQLNRLEARIIEYNLASKRIFEKCGFKIEGMERNKIYKNGEYHNVIIVGLLKDELHA